MADELKSCPFCGGRNPGLWHQDVGVKSFPRVNCGACGSGTGFNPKWTDADAIAAWNRRACDAP